jgi:1,4-dihydroxy-2-naphthoate polyprenyltransferase
MRSKYSRWILASRPKTFSASLVPVLLTSYEVHGSVFYTTIIAVTALLIQVITNFANDLFDFKRGADSSSRVGPPRMVQQGLIAESEMRCALVLVSSIAVGLGAILVVQGGWPILGIGLLSLLSAFAYTSGPFPLAYKSLAEPFVFLFFGPIATLGTSVVLQGNYPNKFISIGILGVICGLFATSLVVINNLRDRGEDAHVGKVTLAVRIGDRATRYEYGVLLLLPLVVSLLGGALGYLEGAAQTASIASLAIAWLPLASVLRGAHGAKLNKVLAQTSLTYGIFGIAYLFA